MDMEKGINKSINKGIRIYNKLPNDIKNKIDKIIYNYNKNYCKKTVLKDLKLIVSKFHLIKIIKNYYLKKYNMLEEYYIINLLRIDLIKWVCFIYEKNIDKFLLNVFKTKNIEHIQDNKISKKIIYKIIMNLSYENAYKFYNNNNTIILL